MLSRGGSPITESHLADVERTLGLALPAAYRAFLREANGGATETIAFFGVDTTPKNPLFGSSTTDVPPETFAFAITRVETAPPVRGDEERAHGPLVLAHDGPRKGQVFFWNEARWTPFFLARHEKSRGSLEATLAKAYRDFFAKLEPVAPSFGALLAAIGGTFVDSMPAIDESDVAAYEKSRGFALPAEYRRWVLETNGGRVEGGSALTLEKGVTGRVFSIGPVRRATPQPTDVRKEHARLRGKLAKGMVPIASGQGSRTFLLDTRGKKNPVLEWVAKKEPKPVAESFEAFLAAATSGAFASAPPKKPARAPTGRDYRAFVVEQLDELTKALIDDLKKRVFPMKLAKGATSLDFEVFVEPLTDKVPIVGYQMNGDRQVTTSNVEILPDTKPVIPARLFEPFFGADIGDEERINTEVLRDWFVRGWRKAGGKKLFGRPASIMIHDDEERITL